MSEPFNEDLMPEQFQEEHAAAKVKREKLAAAMRRLCDRSEVAPSRSAAPPAKCSECGAKNEVEAQKMCIPVEGACPIIEAGFAGPGWPPQSEMDAFEASAAPPFKDWAEKWAKDFHDTYERSAPAFGYETRKESAKPWADVPENNRKLMIAVCAEVLCRFEKERTALYPEASAAPPSEREVADKELRPQFEKLAEWILRVSLLKDDQGHYISPEAANAWTAYRSGHYAGFREAWLLGEARAAVPQAAADREGSDEATEARWQKRIYDLCREAVGPELADTIDGSGCDSGDALDVTVSEIKQAIGIVREAAAVPAPGREWIWVGERMPEYGSASIVYARARNQPDVQWIDLATYSYHGGWSVGNDRDKWGEHEVTHWQPLPARPVAGATAPPKEGEQ